MPMYSPANPASKPIRSQMGTDQPGFDPMKTPSPPGVGGMNQQSQANQQTMTGAPTPPPPRAARAQQAEPQVALHSNLNQAMYAAQQAQPQQSQHALGVGASPGPAPAQSSSFWDNPLAALGLTSDPQAAKYSAWEQANQLYNNQQAMDQKFSISPQYQQNQDLFGQTAMNQVQGNNPIMERQIAAERENALADMGTAMRAGMGNMGGATPQALQQMLQGLQTKTGQQLTQQEAQLRYQDYLQGQQNQQAYQNMVLNPWTEGQNLANTTGQLNMSQLQQAQSNEIAKAQQNQNLLFGLVGAGTGVYNAANKTPTQAATTQGAGLAVPQMYEQSYYSPTSDLTQLGTSGMTPVQYSKFQAGNLFPGTTTAEPAKLPSIRR